MIGGVNIGHALIAGLFAGYVMALAAYWMEGVFGLPRMDLGATGLKYMGGDKPGAWFVGIIAHHVDSMGLALIYAGAVFLNLEDVFRNSVEWWWGPLAGLGYGFVVALVLPFGIMGTIMALAGQRPPMDAKSVMFNVWLHLVWGAALGALYFPLR